MKGLLAPKQSCMVGICSEFPLVLSIFKRTNQIQTSYGQGFKIQLLCSTTGCQGSVHQAEGLPDLPTGSEDFRPQEAGKKAAALSGWVLVVAELLRTN